MDQIRSATHSRRSSVTPSNVPIMMDTQDEEPRRRSNRLNQPRKLDQSRGYNIQDIQDDDNEDDEEACTGICSSFLMVISLFLVALTFPFSMFVVIKQIQVRSKPLRSNWRLGLILSQGKQRLNQLWGIGKGSLSFRKLVKNDKWEAGSLPVMDSRLIWVQRVVSAVLLSYLNGQLGSLCSVLGRSKDSPEDRSYALENDIFKYSQAS